MFGQPIKWLLFITLFALCFTRPTIISQSAFLNAVTICIFIDVFRTKDALLPFYVLFVWFLVATRYFQGANYFLPVYIGDLLQESYELSDRVSAEEMRERLEGSYSRRPVVEIGVSYFLSWIFCALLAFIKSISRMMTSEKSESTPK